MFGIPSKDMSNHIKFVLISHVLKHQGVLPKKKKLAILAKHFITTVACMIILTLQMIAVLEKIQAVGANT